MDIAGFFRNAKEVTTVPAGTVIFNQGDPGEVMYGIVEGEIELSLPDRVIATLVTNDMFGEMALVDHSPRMATATAKSDSTLALIDQRTFLFLIHETPTFALSVMSAMANHFRLSGSTPAPPPA
jgi:CRP-like cAMP-binding protein